MSMILDLMSCSLLEIYKRFRKTYSIIFFNVSLTVHLSITLANDQLDAQIYLLQSSTCFEQYLAHPQEVKLY